MHTTRVEGGEKERQGDVFQRLAEQLVRARTWQAGARWADDAAAIEAMKRKVPATMTECFELIERKLLKGPWVMGEQYTICDPYLFTIGTWIEGDGVDTTKLPRVMEHRKRMLARPAVQKVVAAEGTQIA